GSPRDLGTVRVHPTGGGGELAVSVDGRDERRFRLRDGWNALPLNQHGVKRLRMRLVTGTGIAELQVPGLHVSESLRLPDVLAAEAHGLDLSHSPVSILLQRTTADFPYRAAATSDAEPGLERDLTLPVGRTFALSGWASVTPSAPDPALDRLAGLDPLWTFKSSGRFEGVAGRRASAAFDGRPDTAWIASGARPWISVTAPREFSLA